MYVVSAPGKVILFGEHAVVYGVPAIAASVALHTYVFVTESSDANIVELDFPEVQLVRRWRREDLPWKAVSAAAAAAASKQGTLPMPGTHLDRAVHAALLDLLKDVANPFEHAAALAFLYMYLHLCSPETPGQRFVTRSTLPIGAGLGSSASFSVSLAASLLLLGNHITMPTGTGHNEAALAAINAWSFMGESCIHGNPSGIDNVVATRGGAVLYQRVPLGAPKIEPFDEFPPLGLVLTNTGVPRQTAELVAGVAQLKAQLPTVVEPVLKAIEEVVARADMMIRAKSDPAVLAEALRRLAEINHGLLVALGVSHPALERVRETALDLKIGQTKLTGAGGGGCAITITYDDAASSLGEFTDTLKEVLGADSCVLETQLGGPGVSVCEVASLQPEKILELVSSSDFDALGKWLHW